MFWVKLKDYLMNHPVENKNHITIDKKKKKKCGSIRWNKEKSIV